MDYESDAPAWTPAIGKAAGPVYLAIADALAADILSGVLADGARLPTQRSLASALGVDFTTVTRAYAEARRRGLVEGRVGKGTYVKKRHARPSSPLGTGVVDMSMNLPPRFDDPDLEARMWRGIASLEGAGGTDLLLRYQQAGGALDDRAAGAVWLADRLPGLAPERVLVCPGAQGALLAVVGQLAGQGDTICAETLTYPGIRSLAGHLRLRLAPVEIDGEGIVPESFEAACRAAKPKALYCTPTLHNPTTVTMSLARREAIIAIARAHGVPIIEDDAYGKLAQQAPPPLAALAPDIVFHIASLAKCLSPALRIAYLVAPDTYSAARVGGAVRAVASMGSPLTAAIATRWIQDGTAVAVLGAIRSESHARLQIAATAMSSLEIPINREGFHLWLPLPAHWSRAEFAARLRSVGIGVVGSDVFALESPPEAVRLGLGAPGTRDELRSSLQSVVHLLGESPVAFSTVV